MPDAASRYDWKKLTHLQLGKYAEYLTKMEFILLGCDVFSSEVDQHGIDFVVRTRKGSHYDIQVKSCRIKPGQGSYIFMPKSKFAIDPSSLLAFVKFVQGEPPTLFLIPSCVDGIANPLFENRDYGEGKKSPPEWGLTLSKKKMERLNAECLFEASVSRLF